MTHPPDVQAVLAAHPTLSARIRALADIGYTRSQIARIVDRSYQQVRQVLVYEEGRRARTAAAQPQAPGVKEDAPPFESQTSSAEMIEWFDLDDQGRLTLPPAWLQALGVSPGDRVMAACDSPGSLLLTNRLVAIRQAQAIVAKLKRPGVLASEELIAERRAEAARENDEI